jgi:ATP-dependent helicase/nuclease subunit B
MTPILLTAGAGHGKTQAAIDTIREQMMLNPFSRIWLLLRTDMQIADMRKRLVEEFGAAAHFGVEYFNFYDLYARLLDMAQIPQRRIEDAARFRILRNILEEHQHELGYFESIAIQPGFIRIVADFIKELKQAQILPDDFSAAETSERGRDLGIIYGKYQTMLRERHLVDRDGEGWLALAQLEKQPNLAAEIDLLIVDGYDQFNIVQARLINMLAARVRKAMLTLTYQPERAQTAHRRFAQTRTRLEALGGTWQHTGIPARSTHAERHTLQALSAAIFEYTAQRIPNDGSLTLIEVPDRRREVETVLRGIKRLALTGVELDKIAITARDLAPYAPYFLELAPSYGVPLVTRHGPPLGENPAVATLLSLLDLSAARFPRRDTMDLLRSPYLTCPDLTLEQIDALDRTSREYTVVRGREVWEYTAQFAWRPRRDEDGEGEDEAAKQAREEKVQALIDDLKSFFNRVTPPKRDTARNLVHWIEALIGTDPDADSVDEDDPDAPEKCFDLIKRVRDVRESNLDIFTRDMLALECFKRVLSHVLSAYELVDAWQIIEWDDFRTNLQIAIDNTKIDPPRINRTGRVLLASVYELRGLPHHHIFCMGLSEGEFPAQRSPDVLYTDRERAQLRDKGIAVTVPAEDADESSLFYEITALARQSLTLLRPTIDSRGNEWSPSPYWDAVLNAVDVKPERRSITAGIALHEAARAADALVAIATLASTPETSDELFAAHNWAVMNGVSARWRNVLAARNVERRRLDPRQRHDAYTGLISDPALTARIGEMLGADYTWSASKLNAYGTCPFKFFASELLRLAPLKEPTEGIDVLQYGSLMHEVLERTYVQVKELGLTITPDNADQALEILEEQMQHAFKNAPRKHGFRPTRLWEYEKTDLALKLRNVIKADFSDESPLNGILPGRRITAAQEIRFKKTVITGESGSILVNGIIDRIDSADGRAIVVDYKTGSTPIKEEDMVSGRNVQMLLYTDAAKSRDMDVHAALFWYLGDNTASKPIFSDHAQLNDARELLLQRVERARHGEFINSPTKPEKGDVCSAHCDFAQVCRATRATRMKEVSNV